MILEVPLTSMPQKFEISLGGITYGMRLQWNKFGDFWALDVSDGKGAQLVCGIPLVTGINILEPYEYLGFGGELRVSTDFDSQSPPTSSNLGSQSHLFYVTSDV